MDRHIKSFFGQKTGLIFNSGSLKDEYAYLTLVSKNSEGIWERPSRGEGKIIKLNLLELIGIRMVFEGKKNFWSTVHSFNGSNTVISVKRDSTPINFKVGQYSKRFSDVEIEFFRILLDHVIEEKIINSTGAVAENFSRKNRNGTEVRAQIH